MINALLLLLVIAGLSAQNVTKKQYNIKTVNNGAMFFSSISAMCAALFFVFKKDLALFSEPKLLPYAFGFAITYAMAIIFSYLAISCGSLAITSLVSSYSLMIPTFYGIFFLNEKTSLWLFLGIALLCVSLVLINLKKNNQKDEVKITPRWIVYVILSFLGNGLCTTVQKQQQLDFNGMYKNELMIIALVTVSVCVFVFSLFREKKQIKGCVKFSWLAVICGVANGAVNMLVMVLSNRMPASVMFPLVSSGSIVATVTISILLYKEKLGNMQKFGVLLGIGAIICLNI